MTQKHDLKDTDNRRFGNHVNPTDVILCDRSSDSDGCHKIKKVIGQKYSPQGLQYLKRLSVNLQIMRFGLPQHT